MTTGVPLVPDIPGTYHTTTVPIESIRFPNKPEFAFHRAYDDLKTLSMPGAAMVEQGGGALSVEPDGVKAGILQPATAPVDKTGARGWIKEESHCMQATVWCSRRARQASSWREGNREGSIEGARVGKGGSGAIANKRGEQLGEVGMGEDDGQPVKIRKIRHSRAGLPAAYRRLGHSKQVRELLLGEPLPDPRSLKGEVHAVDYSRSAIIFPYPHTPIAPVL